MPGEEQMKSELASQTSTNSSLESLIRPFRPAMLAALLFLIRIRSRLIRHPLSEAKNLVPCVESWSWHETQTEVYRDEILRFAQNDKGKKVP